MCGVHELHNIDRMPSNRSVYSEYFCTKCLPVSSSQLLCKLIIFVDVVRCCFLMWFCLFRSFTIPISRQRERSNSGFSFYWLMSSFWFAFVGVHVIIVVPLATWPVYFEFYQFDRAGCSTPDTTNHLWRVSLFSQHDFQMTNRTWKQSPFCLSAAFKQELTQCVIECDGKLC